MHSAIFRNLPHGLLVAAAVTAANGQGTVVYRNPPDIPIFLDNATYELDVDQNGIADYSVIKGGSFGFHTLGVGITLH